jgi:hypothetical protein
VKLTFEWFDGRGDNDRDVLDESGRKVGWIASRSRRHSGGSNIHIDLFEGKYTTRVGTFKQCQGFVDGVGKVLGHMTGIKAEAEDTTQKANVTQKSIVGAALKQRWLSIISTERH